MLIEIYLPALKSVLVGILFLLPLPSKFLLQKERGAARLEIREQHTYLASMTCQNDQAEIRWKSTIVGGPCSLFIGIGSGEVVKGFPWPCGGVAFLVRVSGEQILHRNVM